MLRIAVVVERSHLSPRPSETSNIEHRVGGCQMGNPGSVDVAGTTTNKEKHKNIGTRESLEIDKAV
jgi:hypothetical protein